MIKGKIEIKSNISVKTRKILSTVYTPGVADLVRQIKRDRKKVYDLTIKSNCVAVVSDGSAVLGLGNVGAEAALPVMEGKCILFKEFGGLNAFPICISSQKTEDIVLIIKNISTSFAAINLEDIAAPKCFEIESKLQNIGIPVVHDDQHATAIIILAGLINAAKITGKELKTSRIVINGAGAAGIASAKLLFNFGCRNLIIVDSKGIIAKKRNKMTIFKKEIAEFTNSSNLIGDLDDGVKGADILIGLSKKGLFSQKLIKTMNKKAIVFALANPEPEINQKMAKEAGAFIYANGRSDNKNQINNALVFPGFFKGLIEKRIAKISSVMKLNAAYAIASLIKKPNREKFVVNIFDRRLADAIAKSL